MLDKLAIRTAVSNDFDARYKAALIAELTAQGFTAAELAAVDSFIDAQVAEISPTADLGLDIYEVDAEQESTTQIQNQFSDKLAAEASQVSSQKVQAHEVFKARSGLTFPEPIFSEPKFTSPTDIQDAAYTVSEDYPDSVGEIDESKNWFKINKKLRHIEIVHSSGTLIKVDKDGNVTEHIVGNFKRVIEGDFSEEIKGNHDKIVKKSMYQHVGGDYEEVIDKTRTSTTTKESTETVKGDKSEDYKKSHNMDVGSDSTEKVTGTKTLEAMTIEEKSTNHNVTVTMYSLDGKLVTLAASGPMTIKGAPLAFISG